MLSLQGTQGGNAINVVALLGVSLQHPDVKIYACGNA